MWRRRSVLNRILLVLVILGLEVGALGPTPGTTISGAAGTSAGTTSTRTLRAIACPSVSDCYAVGDHGTILATHDAGATWQQQTSGTQDQVSGIACPAAGVCFALTNPGVCGGPNDLVSLLRTTDGGGTWTRTAFPAKCPGPGPSCPSVTTCFAFAQCAAPPAHTCPAVRFLPPNLELYRTTDGGTRWQDRGRTPDNTTSGNSTSGIGVQSLACPTLTACYAGGLDQLAWSTNGGKHWTRKFIYVDPCPTAETYCHQLNLMTCPGQLTCYAGGTTIWGTPNPYGHTRTSAVVVATTDGFRTWTRRVIQSFHGLQSLSCPTPTACFALGGGYGPFAHTIGSVNETGRFATTTDGGATWRVGRIGRYPFTDLACPGVSVCYTAGYLGRLMESTDGGTSWRDQTAGLFLSGTYGARQPLHTYSPWIAATGPWKVTLIIVWGAPPQGPGGNPLGCKVAPGASSQVTIYVRNAQGRTVAGPIHVPMVPQFLSSEGSSTIRVTGKLRLDLVSHCSSFSARIDGVRTTGG